MVYLIAGVLLGAAVAILTLPWSRRDPADFSNVELGYAWRGPRGAVTGALGVLMDVGAAKRSRRRGVVRTGERLPRGLDPLARAVYSGLGSFQGLGPMLNNKSVRDRLPAVARVVVRAGLRVGPVRRALGSLAALAAPVVALVALTRGVGDPGTAIPVSVVTVLVGCWLLGLRGVTVRGARTVATAPRPAAVAGGRSRRRRVALAGSALPAGWMLAGFAFDYGSPNGFGVDLDGGHGGGYDGGGFDGGGSDGGGGDSGGY